MEQSNVTEKPTSQNTPPTQSSTLEGDTSKAPQNQTHGAYSQDGTDPTSSQKNVYTVLATERGLRMMLRLVVDAQRKSERSLPEHTLLSLSFLELRLRDGLSELLLREGRTLQNFDVLFDGLEVIDANVHP